MAKYDENGNLIEEESLSTQTTPSNPLDPYRDTYNQSKSPMDVYKDNYNTSSKAIEDIKTNAIDSAEKTYSTTVQDINNRYGDGSTIAKNNLANKTKAEQKLYFDNEKMKKYLGTYLKSQGLNGQGIAESTAVEMGNNYARRLTEVNDTYQNAENSRMDKYNELNINAQAQRDNAVNTANANYTKDKNNLDTKYNEDIADYNYNQAKTQVKSVLEQAFTDGTVYDDKQLDEYLNSFSNLTKADKEDFKNWYKSQRKTYTDSRYISSIDNKLNSSLKTYFDNGNAIYDSAELQNVLDQLQADLSEGKITQEQYDRLYEKYSNLKTQSENFNSYKQYEETISGYIDGLKDGTISEDDYKSINNAITEIDNAVNDNTLNANQKENLKQLKKELQSEKTAYDQEQEAIRVEKQKADDLEMLTSVLDKYKDYNTESSRLTVSDKTKLQELYGNKNTTQEAKDTISNILAQDELYGYLDDGKITTQEENNINALNKYGNLTEDTKKQIKDVLEKYRDNGLQEYGVNPTDKGISIDDITDTTGKIDVKAFGTFKGSGNGKAQDNWIKEVLSNLKDGKYQDGTYIELNYGKVKEGNEAVYVVKNGRLYKSSAKLFEIFDGREYSSTYVIKNGSKKKSIDVVRKG